MAKDVRKVVTVSPALDIGRFMQAPASPAVIADGFVWTSGYVPLNPETGEAVDGPIEDQTRQTLENLRQVLKAAGTSFDRVVRVNTFLAEESDYAGYNAVYREYFPGDFPSRRTVLAKMIGGFRVEIDCVALAGDGD